MPERSAQERDKSSAVVRTGFAIAAITLVSNRKTANGKLWNAHGKERARQGTVSFVRAATRLELPTPRPAGVASLKRPEGNTFYPYLHKRKGFEHEKEIRAIVQEIPPRGTALIILGTFAISANITKLTFMY